MFAKLTFVKFVHLRFISLRNLHFLSLFLSSFLRVLTFWSEISCQSSYPHDVHCKPLKQIITCFVFFNWILCFSCNPDRIESHSQKNFFFALCSLHFSLCVVSSMIISSEISVFPWSLFNSAVFSSSSVSPSWYLINSVVSSSSFRDWKMELILLMRLIRSLKNLVKEQVIPCTDICFDCLYVRCNLIWSSKQVRLIQSNDYCKSAYSFVDTRLKSNILADPCQCVIREAQRQSLQEQWHVTSRRVWSDNLSSHFHPTVLHVSPVRLSALWTLSLQRFTRL